MSQLPENRKEMLRAGYKLLGNGTCRRCQAGIEWWQTTHGSKLPFDLAGERYGALDPARLHPRDCQPAQVPGATTEHGRLTNLGRIAEQLGARLVLVLDDGGYTYAAKHGLDPEDVKQELITAANGIRREMGAGR